jgi:hypothetical protein
MRQKRTTINQWLPDAMMGFGPEGALFARRALPMP